MILDTLVGLGSAGTVIGAAGLALAWLLAPASPGRRDHQEGCPSAVTSGTPVVEAATAMDLELGLALLGSAPGAQARVEAVLWGDEVFEVLLGPPDLDPPAGFTASVGGKVWTLDNPALLRPSPEGARWPLLVAVGDSEAGRCHLNLGALGLVVISGPAAASLGAHIATQLAGRANLGELDLVVVSAKPEASAPSISTVGTWAEGLAALSDPVEGTRLRVLVCLDPLSADDADRLTESLERQGGLDAAVVVGDVGARSWPLRAEVEQLVLERLALWLSPLPEDRDASAIEPADEAPPPAPASTRRGTVDLAGDNGLLVRVLGPVTVDGSAEPLGGKALELAAYLACHPEGVGDDRLQMALWPERMPARGTFNNLVSLARRQLGTGTDGAVLFPHALERRYRLSPLVRCDLASFEALADQADRAAGEEAVALLVRALEVIAGRPFDAADGYEWAHREGLVAAAERRVVSAAHRLAEDALGAGDLERAEWAARQGLRAAPGDELLFRDRMLVAHAAGSTSAVESIMEELRSHLDGEDPLDALHPDTLELHHRLGQRPLARR